MNTETVVTSKRTSLRCDINANMYIPTAAHTPHLCRTSMLNSIRALEGWDSMALLFVKSVHLHCTVRDIDLVVWTLLERKCMLHPLLVVAFWEVFSRVCTARLLAVRCRFSGLDGAGEEVAEFESFDEVAVPNHAAVFGADFVEHLVRFVHSGSES